MSTTFNVTKWNEQVVDAEKTDFPLNQVHVQYQLEGDLQGIAWVEYLLYYIESNQEDGHLATARIIGRTTFLLFSFSFVLDR